MQGSMQRVCSPRPAAKLVAESAAEVNQRCLIQISGTSMYGQASKLPLCCYFIDIEMVLAVTIGTNNAHTTCCVFIGFSGQCEFEV